MFIKLIYIFYYNWNITNYDYSLYIRYLIKEVSLTKKPIINIKNHNWLFNISSDTLDLSGNYFDSKLPYWLFDISSGILFINLSFNNLKSRIPKSMLNFQNLKYLRLVNNERNGPILNW